MKRIQLILLAVLFSMTAMAQKTIVTGVLKDSLLNQTEPYATVRVYKGNQLTKPVAMSVTGDNGEIKQTVSGNGTYVITFNSVGKKEIRKEFTINGEPSINLGTVYTTDDSKALKGVEIVAQKPLVKMETDKMTYNVQEDVDSKSQTVLDMLRKVPMVTVDGQDNISVNGNSNYKIYVDGKPNPMFNSNASQIFKAMPASMVQNIEVITNPGAKYDAEGTSCILNIVLNHNGANGGADANMDGYNGSIGATASTRGVRGSASISGQQGKFSYNAMGMYNYGKQKGTEVEFDRSQSDGTNMRYYQKGMNRTPFAMGNIGLGLQLDSMSSMHASLNLMKFHLHNEGHPTTTITGGAYGKGFSYSNQNLMTMDNFSLDASADYTRFLNHDRTSSIALTYQFSTQPQRQKNYSYYDKNYSDITAFDISDRLTDNHPHSREHTVQLDYVTPLGKGQTLSVGSKYIYHINRSNSKFFDILNGVETYNADNSMIYQDKQSIGAAYAEYSGTFGKFSTRDGLRYEHTWESISYELGKGSDYKKNYGNLVPSASLTYNINPLVNFGLNYSLHILRPGITYLNPYVDKSNPTALTYGNPNLEVEKSHNIGFVFNVYTPMFLFNLTASQSICNNQIGEYTFIDDKDLLNTTYSNDIRNRWTNINSFMRMMFGKNTTIMFSGGMSYGDIRSKKLDQKNNGWQFNGYLGLEQTLPWALQWSTGLFGQSRQYNLQGYNGGISFFTTAFTKKFFDDKLNISLRYNVPFTGKFKINQYTHSNAYEQKMKITVPIQDISLTITWNFGNTKKQFQQHQTRVNNEFKEQQSVGQQLGTGTTGTTTGTGTGM
ncbi:MAG: TonB-dependent receptor [Prevotella sp.]|jgi:hypothetical protein|nr:TonB-dependent receptor [Prevotella sp.]MCI1246724.1 TonB-dependent receptor [Prevotella sp.]